MSVVSRFVIDSKIRGYHVYQTIWSSPYVGEELECRREPGNSHDPHAVAMMKVISRASAVVGHVPFDISSICSIFIRRGGSIISHVTGSRCYSSDLEKGCLEIPCKLVFSIESEKEANKTRKRLEATLSIVVAMDTLSIRDTSTTDLATDNQAVEIQDRTTDDQAVEVQDRATDDQAIEVQDRATDNQAVEIQDRATDDQAVEVQDRAELMPVVDLSDQAVEHNAVSPQKKRMKLIDSEHIIMGEELTDTEINLAQQLLKKQFPNLNGFKSTLLQDKRYALTEKDVRNKVQIIYCKGRRHWVVASTVNSSIGQVKVYDSLFTYPDKEMERVIMNSFQWNSTEVALKFACCHKQKGGADCGLFAIAFATAIAFGKQPGKLKFIQEELRGHLVTCLNKGGMSLFPCK